MVCATKKQSALLPGLQTRQQALQPLNKLIVRLEVKQLLQPLRGVHGRPQHPGGGQSSWGRSAGLPQQVIKDCGQMVLYGLQHVWLGVTRPQRLIKGQLRAQSTQQQQCVLKALIDTPSCLCQRRGRVAGNLLAAKTQSGYACRLLRLRLLAESQHTIHLMCPHGRDSLQELWAGRCRACCRDRHAEHTGQLLWKQT